MQYCMKCGKSISDGVKFCPYCGTKVLDNPNELGNGLSSKRDKGISEKHLNNQETNIVESQVKREDAKVTSEDIVLKKPNLSNNVVGIYFLLIFLLTFSDPNSDEMIGVFIYTMIVMIIIYIRRNKEKIFNWLLNILVTLQGILIFSSGMVELLSLNEKSDKMESVFVVSYLAVLLVTIVVMLYQGNRRSS